MAEANEDNPIDAAAISARERDAGARLFEKHWSFVKGVVGLRHLPEADRPEIAFAGRSNVGKSSLINAVMRQKGLARTSNTPGRTQEINFFKTDAAPLYVVDLPGYGFAKAPRDKVAAWTALVKAYLRGRPTLARVFLLIDARHGIKSVDETIMALLNEAAVSYQLVLTKADKVRPHDLPALIDTLTEALRAQPAAYPLVLATSAAKGTGIAELRGVIATVMAQSA